MSVVHIDYEGDFDPIDISPDCEWLLCCCNRKCDIGIFLYLLILLWAVLAFHKDSLDYAGGIGYPVSDCRRQCDQCIQRNQAR
jgi:hypothetical protein